MKKFLILFLIIILAGCQDVSFDSIEANIDNLMKNSNNKLNISPNNKMDLFGYYLPSDIKEVECGNDYCVFEYEDSKIYLNLNISGIIGTKYYSNNLIKDDGFLSEDKLIYSSNNENLYCNIYRYDEYYFTHFYSDVVNIYASSSARTLPHLIKRLIILSNGIEISKENIITLYSNKDVIDYEKKPVDLFEYIVPSEGILSELIIEEK